MNNANSFDDIDKLIRSGKTLEAQRILSLFSRQVNVLKRNEKLRYAGFARRLGLANHALKVLNPIVRPRAQYAKAPTAQEQIEYAACLRSEGAPAEALTILEGINPIEFPDASLQAAFCMMGQWRYADAVPYLKAFISSFQSPTYGTLVAKVNLLAAYIYDGNNSEATRLLLELKNDVNPVEHGLLRLNLLELAAQFSISNDDTVAALGYLQEATEQMNRTSQSVYELLISKWTAIARSLQSGVAAAALAEVKAKAKELRNWETVRDCDFYQAKLGGDVKTLIYLYYGTPFPGFRKKVLKEIGSIDQVPPNFVWSTSETAPTRIFDLRRACVPELGCDLAVGKVLHRFLIHMCSDFYRPKKPLSIYASVFPDQFFSIGSTNRVHQMMTRFRSWCQENRIPLAIEGDPDGFHLKFNGPFAISLEREEQPRSGRELTIAKLRASFQCNEFTTREAMGVLGASQPSVQRVLAWAVEFGKAEHRGQTHQSRYRLKSA